MTDSTRADIDDAIASIESHFGPIVERPEDESAELTEDEWEKLRDAIETVGDSVEHSSPGELLEAAHFEDHPETVEYTDLPRLISEASPESTLRLRKILKLRRLADEQSDLSNDQLRRRLEDVLTLGDIDEEGSQFEASLFEPMFEGSSEAETMDSSEAGATDSPDAEADAETEAEDASKAAASTAESSNDEEADGEDSSDRSSMSFEEFSDSIDRFRKAILGDNSDETPDEPEEAAANDGEKDPTENEAEEAADDESDATTDTRDRPRRSRLSTVPSHRSDMNAVPNYSPYRGR